jgi:oligoendopeptidase F
VRSSEIEEVLGLARDPLGAARETHGVLVDTDLTFGPAHSSEGAEIEPAQGNISALLSDPDRETRRTAWESYADAHLAVKHTLANCLSAGVKQDVFFTRTRRYPSSLEAALEPNSIPIQVFYNLIETYKKHLPTWHRSWKVRRAALGYEKLHVYDIKAPLTSREESVPYMQAVEWITKGMRPLGDEYVETLRRGATTERWVDVYPNQHKTSGAYSTGWPGTHPFILMSYTDDIFSMSTLAHELGHSMHSYFSSRDQPFIYAHYGLFVAEVASNFNQAMVRAYLLKEHSDPEFQIMLIEEAMSNFHRYFFIMPTLARFELEIHERVEQGGALTADDLMSLMTELFREGYGGEVEIDEDRIGITWGQFPNHLYANFYVYQYATGISGAHALAERILHGESEAAERYLSFLRAGGSLFPLDALRLAGVDMTSTEPVERAFGVLSRMIDQLEELVGQRAPAAV